jgi:hypothetical protein
MVTSMGSEIKIFLSFRQSLQKNFHREARPIRLRSRNRPKRPEKSVETLGHSAWSAFAALAGIRTTATAPKRGLDSGLRMSLKEVFIVTRWARPLPFGAAASELNPAYLSPRPARLQGGKGFAGPCDTDKATPH